MAEASLARAFATSLEVEPEVDRSGVLHLRDFVLQAGDVRGSRGFLRLQLRGIENGDQVSGFHRSAFIHQQPLDAAFHLCADDYLIRVDRADQHQVLGMVGGEKCSTPRRSRR